MIVIDKSEAIKLGDIEQRTHLLKNFINTNINLYSKKGAYKASMARNQ